MRGLTWVLLPLLAIAYYVIVVSPLDPQLKLIPLEFIYCAPIVVTVVCSVIAYQRSEQVERVFWASLAIGNLILFACELLLIYWIMRIDPAGPPTVAWPFHIMHGIAAVAFIAMLLAMSRFGQSTTATKWRWAIDSMAALVIIAVIITEFYTRPIMEPAGAPVGEVLLGTAYPLFGVIMLAGTLGNLVGFKVDRWRAWDKLVVISLAVYAMAIALWPVWYPTVGDTTRNYERGVLDLVQFGGHWVLMAAAVYRLTAPTGWRIRPLPPIASTRKWVSLILPAVSIIAIPAILWLAISSGGQGPWQPVYASVATLLTIFVVARSIAIALEHGVLFHQSITDPLTGAYNHRFFHEYLNQQLDRAKRYELPLGLLVFDIDDFGEYNNRFGHLAGDRLLCDIAGVLESSCAPSCVVARLGGDVFAIVAPESDREATGLLGTRLLDMISIETGAAPGLVSASAGMAMFPDHAQEAERLVRLADGALFHSKESGRARLTVYSSERVPELSARERMDRLQNQSRVAAVRALTAASESRDADTAEHSRSVADLCVRLGRELGLGEVAVSRVETGALLHEVGRIGLSDSAITDERNLTSDQERRHPIIGQQILTAAGLGDVAQMSRSHHENWDGSGYPDALAAEEISLEARIISVANEYDMLVRGLKPGIARTGAQALRDIEAHSGTQFDPRVVAALRTVLARELTVSASAR